MKLPNNIDKVNLLEPDDFWIFPPIGFLEIEEADNGAGDNYGLYWELGKENGEPIICSKRHEEFLLVPEFVNLNSFLAWYEETEGQESPRIDLKDTTFFLNLFNKSKVLTKTGKTEEAIQTLEKSIQLFGEYCDSWTLLAENYYKTTEVDKAENSSLNSIITNYAFGLPSKKCIEQFNRIDPIGQLKDNPLVKRKDGLLLGGDFANPFSVDYEKLLEAIEEFKEIGDLKTALLLEQNYGYLMSFEQEETKEKYRYNETEWSSNFKDKILTHYPDRK
jgi:tetratricopeptide (TPR) repeat protein